jgi:RNA polymerase sigma factor (sigma-70 family)
VFNCVKRHSERLKSGIDKAQLLERGYMSLLSAVDGFDPWMGHRFSTYACNAITRSFFNRTKLSCSLVSIEEANDVASKIPDDNSDLWIERMQVALKTDSLSPREKEVLKYRFNDKLTLKEVGDIWGLTKERVRQVQMEAMSKLRDKLNKDIILS